MGVDGSSLASLHPSFEDLSVHRNGRCELRKQSGSLWLPPDSHSRTTSEPSGDAFGEAHQGRRQTDQDDPNQNRDSGQPAREQPCLLPCHREKLRERATGCRRSGSESAPCSSPHEPPSHRVSPPRNRIKQTPEPPRPEGVFSCDPSTASALRRRLNRNLSRDAFGEGSDPRPEGAVREEMLLSPRDGPSPPLPSPVFLGAVRIPFPPTLNEARKTQFTTGESR